MYNPVSEPTRESGSVDVCLIQETNVAEKGIYNGTSNAYSESDVLLYAHLISEFRILHECYCATPRLQLNPS